MYIPVTVFKRDETLCRFFGKDKVAYWDNLTKNMLVILCLELFFSFGVVLGSLFYDYRF